MRILSWLVAVVGLSLVASEVDEKYNYEMKFYLQTVSE